MIGLFTKKAFFDGWDNFLSMVIHNMLYLALLILTLTGISFLGENNLAFYIILLLFFFFFSILMGGTAEVTKNYSNYISETWRPFFKGIKRNIKHSLVFFFLTIILIFLAFFTIPFYASISGILGILLSVIMFWVLVIILFSLPYYFPLMTLMPGDGPFKTLKKCFLVSSDNLGATLYLILHFVVDVVFSVLTVGLISGVTGIMLSNQDMMKLIMKKYDYLEENPDKTRKDINWDELLQEEKDTIGPRSLKSMIFPWK